jgi:hypothetical protein
MTLGQRVAWLALALMLTVPAWAQPVLIPATTATVALPTSTQATTKLLSGALSKSTIITALHIIPASGAIVTWSAGTGTNCGTNNVVLDGPATYGSGVADNRGSDRAAFRRRLPSGGECRGRGQCGLWTILGER